MSMSHFCDISLDGAGRASCLHPLLAQYVVCCRKRPSFRSQKGTSASPSAVPRPMGTNSEGEQKKEAPKRDAHALAPSADRQSQREPRWIAQSLSTGNLKYALPRIGEYEMRKWSPPICKRETFQLGTQFHPTRERPFRGFL